MSFLGNILNRDGEISDTNFNSLEKLIKKSSGEILLNSDFLIDRKEISKFSNGIKVTKDNLVIDGNGHLINAKSFSRIFQIKAKNVIFKNITFINGYTQKGGGAFYIHKNSSVTFENCIFRNNHSQINGGAIYNDQGNLTLKNCCGDFNKAKDGGFILNDEGSVIFDSCNFRDNSAQGGGVLLNDNGNFSIINSNFKNNKGEIGGSLVNSGELKINKCDFEGNESTNQAGVILNNPNSNIILKNCKFRENKAKLGGSIYNLKEAHISFESCSFDSNWASDYGGVLVNEGHGNLKDNCSFTNNRSFKGAGIFNAKGKLTVKNAIFKTNLSNLYAGAIYSYYNAILDLEDCIFEENDAGQGGAILILQSESCIKNSIFNDNTSRGAGGAIFNSDANSKFIGCNFKNNIAQDGGAIKIDSSSKLELSNCNFDNNKATKEGGGAIYLHESKLKLNDSSFKNNCTENLGGAICAFHSDISLNSCTFEVNSSESNGGAILNSYSNLAGLSCNFDNNVAKGDGAAIYSYHAKNDNKLTLKDCDFNSGKSKNGSAIANYEGNMIIHSSNFENNNGERGGAIFNDKISSCEISDSSFEDNSAGLGGAIDNWNKLCLNNCNFESNEALELNSGAINHMSGELRIKTCRFENNSAKGGASVLSSIEGSVFIESSSFNDNKSQSTVILNKDASLDIIDCVLEDNVNADEVCIISGGLLKLNSTSFINDDEIILAIDADSYIESCDFEAKCKIQSTGRIYVLGDEKEIIQEMVDKTFDCEIQLIN